MSLPSFTIGNTYPSLASKLFITLPISSAARLHCSIELVGSSARYSKGQQGLVYLRAFWQNLITVSLVQPNMFHFS
jgi:hypothetical protein